MEKNNTRVVRKYEDIPDEIQLLSGARFIIESENATVIQRSDGCFLSQYVIMMKRKKTFSGNIRNLWKVYSDGGFALEGIIMNEFKYMSIPQLSKRNDPEIKHP